MQSKFYITKSDSEIFSILRECPPDHYKIFDKGNSAYDPIIADEAITKFKYHVSEITGYRKMETIVFYSQIFAIILYIIICKLFKILKKWRNQIDITDPFMRILKNKEEDFLENENFFMKTVII